MLEMLALFSFREFAKTVFTYNLQSPKVRSTFLLSRLRTISNYSSRKPQEETMFRLRFSSGAVITSIIVSSNNLIIGQFDLRGYTCPITSLQLTEVF